MIKYQRCLSAKTLRCNTAQWTDLAWIISEECAQDMLQDVNAYDQTYLATKEVISIIKVCFNALKLKVKCCCLIQIPFKK